MPLLQSVFTYALRCTHGGHVWLICTADGELRVFATPTARPPRGTVLLHSAAPDADAPDEAFALRWQVLDRRQCAADYARSLSRKPRYPIG